MDAWIYYRYWEVFNAKNMNVYYSWSKRLKRYSMVFAYGGRFTYRR